jgi:hypothetical protein
MELLKCGMVEEVKEIFFLKNLIRLEKQKTSDGVTREFLGSQRMSIIAIAKKKEIGFQQTSINKISRQKEFTCLHF